MLVALMAVGCLPGCDKLLGISDPTPADRGDAKIDDDGGPTIDSSPPCVTAAAFKPEESFAIGATGTALVVGQLDRMSGRDVAIAVGDGVQIMSGNATGTFSRGMKITTTTTAADGLVSDDFDNDGDSDFVVWDDGGTTMTAIRQNSTVAPSTYLAEQPLTGPFAGVQGVLVGFIDGAFVPDLVVKDAAGAVAYTSRLGTPGTFAREANAIPGVGGGDALVALGQLDGLGGHDAVFVAAGGDVKLAANAPAFSPAVTIASEARDRCVGFGKLDEGATTDMLVGTSAGGVIYQGGGGTFTKADGAIASVSSSTVQVIDVNGDLKDDLVLANRIVYQCAPAAAGGPGVFSQFEDIDATGPALMVDVTGDGKPDLLRIAGAELKVRVQQ
jgi:hypothetical protein